MKATSYNLPGVELVYETLLSFLSLLSTKTFRKMCLNDCVLPEDVLNKAEQASNSLIPEKSKGRYVKSNEKIKQ
jgi:hypothetical protein